MPYCPIDATPVRTNATQSAPPARTVEPYYANFTSASAGLTPAWVEFIRSDTGAALTPPAWSVVAASGRASFSIDWAQVPDAVQSIYYVATAGSETQWDLVTPGN